MTDTSDYWRSYRKRWAEAEAFLREHRESLRLLGRARCHDCPPGAGGVLASAYLLPDGSIWLWARPSKLPARERLRWPQGQALPDDVRQTTHLSHDVALALASDPRAWNGQPMLATMCEHCRRQYLVDLREVAAVLGGLSDTQTVTLRAYRPDAVP